MIQNSWHYPRPLLAKKYLDLFDMGLTSARGLFARRRMGKTEFLKKDFIPAADKAGYLVVYTNLWELEIDPATALVSELYRVIQGASLRANCVGGKRKPRAHGLYITP